MKRISLLLLLIVLVCSSVMAQNKALSLDGDGDYVQIPDSDVFNITDEITMEAWVMLNDTGIDAKIISRRPAYVLTVFRSHKAETEVFTNGQSYETRDVDGGTVLEQDQWHHVAGTFDGKQIVTYIDGHLDRAKEHQGKIDVVDFPIRFGLSADKKDYGFLNGRLDEVRIWNVARAEAEIQASIVISSVILKTSLSGI